MTQSDRLILGSGSAIRASLLRGAGLDFEIIRPDVDEAAIKNECLAKNVDLETLALTLATKKAEAIDASSGDWIIGSDQILEFQGEAFDKPTSMAEAHQRLMAMQGQTHSLINASVVRRGDEIIWQNIERPKLTMRAMDGDEVTAYLDLAGDDVLSSVGAYQIERFGAALFERIDGDFFAVLGLGLSPLLSFLADHGLTHPSRIGKPLNLAGVIGTPIRHTLSPMIHQYWADQNQQNGFYMPFEVENSMAAFERTARVLSGVGFRGLNVTIPHKEHCLASAKTASDRAKQAGAANMLTLHPEGWAADNSDIAGFTATISMAGTLPEDPTLLLLGAGGAARGCILASLELGVKRILIANRTREKAEALQSLSDKISVIDWSARESAVGEADIIANATSLGMAGAPALELSLDLSLIHISEPTRPY